MKLRDWMKANDHTPTTFAKVLGVSQGTVSRYMTGARLPTGDMVVRIHEATDGQVTGNDWYDLPQSAAS